MSSAIRLATARRRSYDRTKIKSPVKLRLVNGANTQLPVSPSESPPMPRSLLAELRS